MNQLLQSAWRFLGSLRRTEVYFTLHGPDTNGYFTLFLSDLPPFGELADALAAERFLDKYLILYFGLHGNLGPQDLLQAGIATQTLPYHEHTLYSVQSTPENLAKLRLLTKESRDWWFLTQPSPPTAQHLEKLGMIAGPAACEQRCPDLQGEILVNYFVDPSFHGFSKTDFEVLLQKLFASGFNRLYRKIPAHFPPQATLKPLEILGFKFGEALPGCPTPILMRGFWISGGEAPGIMRLDWPSHQAHRMRWRETQWGSLQPNPRNTLAYLFTIMTKYLTLLVLAPVALVIVPLTVSLWAIWAVFLWIQKALGIKQRQE